MALTAGVRPIQSGFMIGLRACGCWRALVLIFLAQAPAVRAQFTEVPTTVPVGTWQIEADVASMTLDSRTLQRDGVSERAWTIASTLLTTGVTPKLDLQAGFEPYLRYSYRGGGTSERYQGRGDSYLRAKWNFWGDESAGPALALLPYVKFPTGRNEVGNGRVEGGVILPFGMPLSDGLSLSANVSIDWADDGGGGRDTILGGSGVLLRRLTDRWFAYAEAGLSMDPSRSREWASLAGVGVTWAMTEKFSWDLAGYAALTRAAPDWTVTLRLVWIL